MSTTCLINRMLGGATLFLLWVLAACTEDRAAETLSGNVVEVTQAIEVSVQPMQRVGSSTTRAEKEQPEAGEAIHVSYRNDAVTRVQEEETDKTVTESTINNAYVLQFSGTSSASILKKKISLSAAQVKSESPITCNFVMTAGVKNRVYVVANCTKTLTEGTTTLGTFEAVVSQAPTTSVPSGGLPMSACQDVGIGDAFRTFQLRSLLAKLTFTTNTGTLSLRGLPSGYSYYTEEPGESGVRPADMSYTSTYTLVSGTTYYVPENLSGQGNFSSSVARISKFAPANSMYIQISANSTTYNIYLGDGSAEDFNVAGNHAYDVIAKVLAASFTDPRVGTPTITNLSVSGTANCYIATAANTWYSFRGTVMGNGATTLVPVNMASTGVASPIIPQPLNPIGADVLWETLNTTTAPNKGSIVSAAYAANGTMLIRTGSEQGNAVVAARDARNNIIWSWHIWRINTDPTLAENTATTTSYTSTNGTFDDTGTTTHPGFTMMKLNLGALSATSGDPLANGLFYQWGRKDPFKGAASTSANTDMIITPASAYSTAAGGASITPADAVKNPTTYYTDGDWTSRNDNLWGTPLTKTVISSSYNSNPGSKSIYDPCPAGWRVPPAYVYANATRNNCPWDAEKKGRDFKGVFNGTSVWFPFSGFRYLSGLLVSVGEDGNCWGSTPLANNPTYKHIMYFNSGGVGSTGSGHGTNGFSCRCVLE